MAGYERESTEAFVARCRGMSKEDQEREFWKRAARDAEAILDVPVELLDDESLAKVRAWAGGLAKASD